MITDDILAVLIGADVGLQERANRQMHERGEEPTFWQRHPMLPYVIGFVAGPFLIIPIGFGIIMWMVLVTSFDAHHGNTGIFDLLGLIVLPIWFIRNAVRLHRRKRELRAGTGIVRR